MKIHILYPFKAGPWGGANQFLKAIKDYFIKIDVYTESIEEADIVLFNSSPYELLNQLKSIKFLKDKYKTKYFVNRIDGPVYLSRERNLFIDKAFYKFNEKVCEGTIFQSNWSKNNNYKLGMKKNLFETTVINAPNSAIFNKKQTPFDKTKKARIIATSWSNNWKKGFEEYKWLDENLDFSKYEMTFVGNSPIKFKNIISKPPMNSQDLANELKTHDIFITASKTDACSNSLIEALHCGLPSIGINDGGHPEIIASAGGVYNNINEVPAMLDDIVKNYEEYQKNITLPTIDEVGNIYFEFLKNIVNSNVEKKKLDFVNYAMIKSFIFIFILEEKLYALKRKLKI